VVKSLQQQIAQVDADGGSASRGALDLASAATVLSVLGNAIAQARADNPGLALAVPLAVRAALANASAAINARMQDTMRAYRQAAAAAGGVLTRDDVARQLDSLNRANHMVQQTLAAQAASLFSGAISPASFSGNTTFEGMKAVAEAAVEQAKTTLALELTPAPTPTPPTPTPSGSGEQLFGMDPVTVYIAAGVLMLGAAAIVVAKGRKPKQLKDATEDEDGEDGDFHEVFNQVHPAIMAPESWAHRQRNMRQIVIHRETILQTNEVVI